MIIGLTGGIGSGKSLVSQILENEYGFVSIRTDSIASELMQSDPALIAQLKQAFGKEIYCRDGTLDKKKYAGLIYDSGMQETSDRIVHPAVWRETDRRIRELIRNSRNVTVETALPGTELKERCDAVWHVLAERKVRIVRLMETRGYTEQYAETVMDRQPSDEFYRGQADVILENSGTVSELREEIRRLL